MRRSGLGIIITNVNERGLIIRKTILLGTPSGFKLGPDSREKPVSVTKAAWLTVWWTAAAAGAYDRAGREKYKSNLIKEISQW